MTGLTLAHKMDSGPYTSLTLTASLLTSVLVCYRPFRAHGFKQHPVTGMRGLGAGLLVAGIWLIAKF